YAGALNSNQQNWKDHFEVVAESDGRLALDVKKGGVNVLEEGLLGGLLYTFDKRTATEAINKVNVVFDTLGDIAESMGMDRSMKPALYTQFLREMNVDLEQGET